MVKKLANRRLAGLRGEFLVFSTYAQLTTDDTNAAKDVYRYDTETGVISRVSVGEDGYDPDGGGGTLGASIAQGHRGGSVRNQYEMNNRAISEDGSRIVFTSGEPLSPSDTNGLVNAYEWHADVTGGGTVALVSTGSDQEAVTEVVISPDGSSVLFDTVQGLVSLDTDGAPDIYDARLGEGFPPSDEAPDEPCEGDGCQGPLTNPAPLLVPGSVSQAPGGNLLGPVVSATKAKAKPKCKRGYSRDKAGKCTKLKRKARKSAVAHRASHKSNGGGIS